MPAPDYCPAFASPLTDEQHARLGRIAVLWGHIDMLLDELLLKVLKLSKAQRTVFIGEKPIGPKLDLLKPAIKTIKDPAIRERVQKLYDMLNETKAQRNHIFHGSWGWRADEKRKTVFVCARHPKSLTNPVKGEDLPKIERQLCEASRLAMDAFSLYRRLPLPAGVMRFTHGPAKSPRKWFERWREQHPLTAANWDRSCKEGELPRLVDPLG